MTMREATFGDLFRIAFWVGLGPSVAALALMGLMLSALALILPGLPAALSDSGLLHLPAGMRAAGAGATVGAIWLVLAAYALLTAAFLALRAFSGALMVMVWRRAFPRRNAAPTETAEILRLDRAA